MLSSKDEDYLEASCRDKAVLREVSPWLAT